jgi:hypothetical protein
VSCQSAAEVSYSKNQPWHVGPRNALCESSLAGSLPARGRKSKRRGTSGLPGEFACRGEAADGA